MEAPTSAEDIMMRQQQMAEAEERRLSILDQILETGAKDRLARLSLVKKEKARVVEDALISAATNGKLQGKVTEVQLIQMLEQFSGADNNDGNKGVFGGKTRVIIQRKKNNFDDQDDDDDDSDLL